MKKSKEKGAGDNMEDFISDDNNSIIDSYAYGEQEPEFSDEEARKLPSVSDPKLWRVRVKKGWERIAAMALMNKQIDYSKNKGLTFSIYSATQIDNIENFIFVEAHKIDAVKEAIQGLSFCF